ncbi:hypothetical protein [Anaerotignum sp. MB30-C6]|uniref:hypothetical protein n=1 Tax=Anaerotignum sp. MB30-C6 TaxID=3070814 RepID=UPI0027DBBC95|nr:hypothetical protein [Anaerotignum sp. MB30-C6]WMI81139.1 hypothetical protein RBQ60_15245 [Anaerotignum sp. MB30-C6]
MNLFLPWEGSQEMEPRKDRKVFLPKRRFPLEDLCFKTIGSPYFSLPNPSGTVRSFLRALEKDHEDEAMGYLSNTVASVADLDGIKKLFGEKKELLFFSDDILNEIRTVSLACQCEEGKTEVIFVRMVSEPDHYGKWKIYSIEKE